MQAVNMWVHHSIIVPMEGSMHAYCVSHGETIRFTEVDENSVHVT